MTTSDRQKNNELLFRQKIQSQLFLVRALLNPPSASRYSHQRSPVYFADYAKHTYQDKFGLAEFLTNVSLASQMNVLDVLGVDEEKFQLMHGIVNGTRHDEESKGQNGGNVNSYADCNKLILRFAAEETCVKMEQEEAAVPEEIEGGTPGKLIRRKSTDGIRDGPFFGKKKVKETKDNHWKVTVEYSIKVIATCLNGSGKDPPPIPLKERTAETILHTAADASRPLQAKVVRDPIDFDLTWLFRNISSQDFSCNFVIDQAHKTCRTARRNRDIDAAINYFSELEDWCQDICTYFLKGTCWNVDSNESRPDLDSIHADVIFVPVLPILEPPSSALLRKNLKGHGEVTSLSPLLPMDDIRLFLSEQCRTLDEKIQDLVASFPHPDPSNITTSSASSTEETLSSLFSSNSTSLVTSSEATIFLLLSHSASITEYYIDSMQAIEQATVEVLNKACGREISEKDFDSYVNFNNSKLFCEEVHIPKAFRVEIRSPNRVPAGIISIEMSRSTGSISSSYEESWPIHAITREVSQEEKAGVQIKIANSASMANLSGKMYVHGWLTHQFAGQYDFQYQLRSISRQFSCFLVLTGTMLHDHCMNVKNAMIIQNKEEVAVPLSLIRAREARGFSGLASSLSPQQLSFVQSAREVQLESSIFAVCVVDIKPQLELLLGLPSDSLTKEIKLVEALISLFVDHQISADLVSYNGPPEASVKDMIEEVKVYVDQAFEMVSENLAEDNDELQSTGASAADTGEEARLNYPFQRGNAVKDSASSQRNIAPGVAATQDKISSCASDDNTSIADLFRKKRSTDTLDQNMMMDELTSQQTGGDQFIIDPFPKSMRRVPSVDYLDSTGGTRAGNSGGVAQIPRKLNAKLKLLQNKQLQQTAVETGNTWVKRNLLNTKRIDYIDKAEQEVNTKNALNLLDAMSRSGSLPIQFSELHAIVGVTHCFRHTLMDTLVLDNVDPIKQLSDSTLILASVIHDVPVDCFTRNTQ